MTDRLTPLITELSKRATRGDIQELTEAVRTVSEQIEVVHNAIDELTELLEHTVQNPVPIEDLLQEHLNAVLAAIQPKGDRQGTLFSTNTSE